MRQGYKDARMIYDAEIFECPECHQEFIVGGARGQRTEDRGQTPDPRPLTPVFCPSCRMMVTE
jgi:hypothetical protein